MLKKDGSLSVRALWIEKLGQHWRMGANLIMTHMEDLEDVESFAVGLSQRLLIVANSSCQGEKVQTAG